MVNFYDLAAILFSVAVAVTYINSRFLKLPATPAVMLASLLISLVLLVTGLFGFHGVEDKIAFQLSRIDFHDLLMNGMLSFLLFAGALTVDINSLSKYKWEIGVLATISTLMSTFLIGIASYYLLNFLGFNLEFIYCLLFGALISPTDPIAVLAMLKDVGAPRSLEMTVAGESLFNDGVGIVIFITLYQVAFGSGGDPSWSHVSLLFVREAFGGILYGMLLGVFAHWLLKPIDDHKVEIFITLGIVTGGYALAQAMEISGPLAMVVAGIFVGNSGKIFSSSKQSRESLDNFWELIDEILNAILFLMIGFEMLVIPVSKAELIAGLVAVPLVLLMRFITVATPMTIFKQWRSYAPHTINIMVWGGLRGGLAVALALSLPSGGFRNIILTMTYAVVAFAVIFQGLSIKPLVVKSNQLAKQQQIS